MRSTTPPRVPAPLAEAALWNELARQVREEGVASIVDFLSKDMFTGETRLNNRPLVDYLGSMMKEASVNGAAGGGVALAERPDPTSVLPKIDVPTLFLFGIDDSLTPANLAQSMAEKVSNSTVVLRQRECSSDIPGRTFRNATNDQTCSSVFVLPKLGIPVILPGSDQKAQARSCRGSFK